MHNCLGRYFQLRLLQFAIITLLWKKRKVTGLYFISITSDLSEQLIFKWNNGRNERQNRWWYRCGKVQKKIEMGRGLTFYLSSVKKPPGLQILISINIEKDLTFWLPRWCSGKDSPCNAGDVSLIPGSGRSPEEANGNPLQCSCLGNHMDRGAWQATVHGAAKSWT